MKYLINLVVLICSVSILAGCTSEVVKAPCDHQGKFCGRKIKINQW